MIYQLRIYTINRGAMDDFLTHFHDQTMPLHEKVGMPIVSTLVNRPQNEFIWCRSFTDAPTATPSRPRSSRLRKTPASSWVAT